MKYLIVMAMLACCLNSSAQIINPKETAKRKTNERVNSGVDRTIDRGLDKVEEGIGNIFKKKDKTSKKNEEAPVSAGQSKADLPVTSHSAEENEQETDFTEYKGSGFVAGKNTLFFEDFSKARLETGQGNWHVTEIDASEDSQRPFIGSLPVSSQNWLKMPRKGIAFPNGFSKLPEECTIEFDIYADPEKMTEHEGGFRTSFVAREDREEYSVHWNDKPEIGLDVHPHGATRMINFRATMEYNGNLTTEQMTLFDKTFKDAWKPGEINRVAIYRKGTLVRLFLNGKEYISLPSGLPKKLQYNFLVSTNLNGDGIYVSNIRIAGQLQNTKAEMDVEGKFVSRTIYFDVNSAHIKAESWSTLKEIAGTLRDVKGLVRITGHTDSDGSEEANLTLSLKRAAAVKNALVKEFNINSEKLSTDGKGESEPVEKGNTATAKAQNRRVEFILVK